MDACSCVYVGDTDDARDFYQEESPKARVPHICGECGVTIQPGERYRKCVGKWDGRFETYKMCSVCQEILDAFFCDGFFFGQLHDDLRGHILDMGGEIKGACLAALSPRARETICEMIEEYWEENYDEDE